jgi:hypothetical protein
LPWEEKDLEDLMEREKRESGVREERRKREISSQHLKRDKWIREMRYFWVKPNKYPSHEKLPFCPCLKRV